MQHNIRAQRHNNNNYCELALRFHFSIRLPVEVSVIATKEQEFNFNLHCQVKRKPSPAVLNVKAEGYAINVSLSCKGTQGEEFTLAIGRASKATIDMGEVSQCIHLQCFP